MPYLFEVMQYNWHGKCTHQGYMDKLFDTKEEACTYYKMFNKGEISKQTNWCSEQTNGIIYIIRTYTGHEYKSIPSFDKKIKIQD
jgi:hypothetical protein